MWGGQKNKAKLIYKETNRAVDFVLPLAEHMSTWHKMVHDTLARGVAEGSRESTRIAI